MANKKNKRVRRMSGVAVAMRKRYPRKQIMRHRAYRRPKDARNSWQRDHE